MANEKSHNCKEKISKTLRPTEDKKSKKSRQISEAKSTRAAKSKISSSDSQDKSSSGKIANKIIKNLSEFSTLFRDQHDVAYIAPLKSGRKIIPIESSAFENYVGSVAFNEYGRSLSDNSIKKIIIVLKGLAIYDKHAKMNHLEVRHYREEKGILWYDLGGFAVKIIPDNGWEIISDPPIIFKRFSHQEPQANPESGGSIELLHDYVNIEDECDWLLFQVFAISCFIPNFPKPLLVLNGSQGSGKSTPLRILKALIDPSKLKSTPIPKSISELARVANHHSILFFDNLSKMPMDVSDNLCRLSTGDGFSKRKLYTDDDEIVYELQRPIMFDGINQIITQADLLDRSILIELERIPDDKRKTEDEIWTGFYKDRPFILGAIFDILSKAMAIYPTVGLKKLPRMADFAKWGYAIAESMKGYSGDDFVGAYDIVLEKQNDEALNASPLATFIIWFMRDKDSWCGTATNLYKEFEDTKYSSKRVDNVELFKLEDNPMWPKDPSSLGRLLTRIATNLKTVGFEVVKFTERNERKIKITRLPWCRYKKAKASFYLTEDAEQFYRNYYNDIDGVIDPKCLKQAKMDLKLKKRGPSDYL